MSVLVAVLRVGMVLFAAFQYASPQINKGCCIGIAMDQSTSMTTEQFITIKNFTAELIDSFDKFGQPDGQLVAVIKFSTVVKVVLTLDEFGTDKEAAILKVIAAEFDGGRTNTHIAINRLCDMIRLCPPGYNKAIVIITDGISDDQTATVLASKNCQKNNTEILVVGIGASDDSNLQAIVSKPNFFFPVASFDSLLDLKAEILDELCSEDLVATTMVTTTKPPNGPCDKCLFMNGLYLFPNYKYCYVFHTCISKYHAYSQLRPCCFGQFFDKSAATCRPARLINCPSDPCKVPGTVSYPNHMNCRWYWVCENLRTSYAKCCDAGQRFIQGTGCSVDPTCTDMCPPKPQDYVCDLRAYAPDKSKYEQHTNGDAWVKRDCAAGTSFVSVTCRCSAEGPFPPMPGCTHDLYLPFERNVQDIYLRKYVTNNRPRVLVEAKAGAIGNKAARFTGNNRLIVKGYANSWWGNKLIIRTRFLETARSPPLPAGMREVLFGNGDCGKGASISVKYDRANNRVIGKIVTVNKKVHTVSLTAVSAGAWKKVELKYDGVNLYLVVDNQVASVPASGVIARRQTALQIGAGCQDKAEYFTGYQDEFYVFLCIV